MFSLHGKTALVTGSSRGLGRETALTLAKQGSNVIICYRNKETEAQKVVDEIQSLGVKSRALRVDLNGTHDLPPFILKVKAVLKEMNDTGTLDILVNNAGIERKAMFGQFSEEDYDQVFDTNVKSVFFLTQGLLDVLVDGGRIIMIGSGLTRFSLDPYIVYAASKAALTSFATYMAKTLGSRKITVNTVAPGALKTDLTKEFYASNPQVVDMIKANCALGRIGLSQDIGGVIAFLCTDADGWITGQRIEVSGGMAL